jgi:hypothetical protein
MNYTEMYRKIYEELKTEELSHDHVHKSTLSICEAISNLYLLTNEEFPSIIPTVSEIMNSLYERKSDITS